MTTNGQLVTTEPDAEDQSQVDDVMRGLQHYHGMRADNVRHKKAIEEFKSYVAKLEAANEELNQQLIRARAELERFRLIAIEAKTHIGIVLGHVTHAYESVKNAEQ